MVNENKTWFLDFSEKGQMLHIPEHVRSAGDVEIVHL